MLPTRYVLNLQLQLEYRTDIAILTGRSEALLAFAMCATLRLTASSMIGAPRRSNKKSGFHILFESATGWPSFLISTNGRYSLYAARSMFYRFNNCFKKMDCQQGSLPMIGHQISESFLGSFTREPDKITIFVSSPDLARGGEEISRGGQCCNGRAGRGV